MNTCRFWIACGAFLAGTSVALGAFGAHGLPGYLAEQQLGPELLQRRLANWDTAAHYQMVHALALLAIAWLTTQTHRNTSVTIVGWLFVFGTLIFSGCLYLLVLLNIPLFGAIVPIGGVLYLAGWFLLFSSALAPTDNLSRKQAEQKQPQ